MSEGSNAMKRRVLQAVLDQNERGLLPRVEELAMITGIEAEKVASCMKWLEGQGYVTRPAYSRDDAV